jgi:hypothetical protein
VTIRRLDSDQFEKTVTKMAFEIDLDDDSMAVGQPVRGQRA